MPNALADQLVREAFSQDAPNAKVDQLVREARVVDANNAKVNQLVREAWISLVSPSQVTLIGGGFQDFLGNPLALGYLTMSLDTDETFVSGAEQIPGLAVVRIPLDSSGNVSGSPQVWPNDILNPTGSLYTVVAYAADGTQAWASPQRLEVLSGSTTFNVGTWIPTNPA